MQRKNLSTTMNVNLLSEIHKHNRIPTTHSLTDLWMERTLGHGTWIMWAGPTSWTCFPPFQRQDVLPYWSPQNATHMLTDALTSRHIYQSRMCHVISIHFLDLLLLHYADCSFAFMISKTHKIVCRTLHSFPRWHTSY